LDNGEDTLFVSTFTASIVHINKRSYSVDLQILEKVMVLVIVNTLLSKKRVIKHNWIYCCFVARLIVRKKTKR